MGARGRGAQAASSESRYATRFATSSALPISPVGDAASLSANAAASSASEMPGVAARSMPVTRGVRMSPGSTALQRTPAPIARRHAAVKRATAALALANTAGGETRRQSS